MTASFLKLSSLLLLSSTKARCFVLFQKFILKLPGGIFTPEGEEYLLEVLTMTRRFEQCQRVNEYVFDFLCFNSFLWKKTDENSWKKFYHCRFLILDDQASRKGNNMEVIIIIPMTVFSRKVGVHLSTWQVPSIYLGWKPEKYSFVHGMSWTSRPGRDHRSPGQATANILQHEGLLWLQSSLHISGLEAGEV